VVRYKSFGISFFKSFITEAFVDSYVFFISGYQVDTGNALLIKKIPVSMIKK